MKNILDVCLFGGRHDLPQNEGAICTSFDFTYMRAEINQNLFHRILTHLKEENSFLRIYVTGLTPALTDVLSRLPKAEKKTKFSENVIESNWHGSIILMHYNKETGDYVPQVWSGRHVDEESVCSYCGGGMNEPFTHLWAGSSCWGYSLCDDKH